jgi:altronate dehydratase large subunit
METFQGYERPDGTVGIRNHVAVIPSVSCANGVVDLIARGVPDAVPLFHGHGCGRSIEVPIHKRTLVNLGKNPNVAAVLIVGLGCEILKAEGLVSAIAESGKPVEYLSIQRDGGSRKTAAKGIDICNLLLRDAATLTRKTFGLDRIIMGLECGGSDAFSGVTANPAVGLASDWLVDQGGTVILTEDTEMIGTSHILERRAKSADVASAVAKMVGDAEKLTHDLLGPLAPYVIAPGNMDGGMSSIQEKSLGCIVKAGSRSIHPHGRARLRHGVPDGAGGRRRTAHRFYDRPREPYRLSHLPGHQGRFHVPVISGHGGRYGHQRRGGSGGKALASCGRRHQEQNLACP